MSDYEDVRPLEGMATPLKVRHELRQSFERWLPRGRNPRVILNAEGLVDELSLLELSRYYRLEYAGATDDVASAWDNSPERIADGGPTFAELEGLGWVFFDGGRWVMQSTPVGTRRDITFPSPSTQSFLDGLRRARFIPKEETPPVDAQALVARIAVEEWLASHIPMRDPDWVAGRLWERLCPKPSASTGEADDTTAAADASETTDADAAAVDKAFVEWSTWCDALGSNGLWDIYWGVSQQRYCREAAHRVLGSQNLWGTWGDDANRYADVLETTFAIPKERLRISTFSRRPPPRTLVARVDWLGSMEVEYLMMERFGASTVSFALELLCSELEKTGIGPDLVARAAAFLAFVADHPMALQQLLYRLNVVPALLVDMLMNPLVASLAARLTIEWRSESSRQGERHIWREAQTKAYAVEDALSLLAYHLKRDGLDLEELASLISWCYAGSPVADSRRLRGRQLLGLVAKDKDEVQSAVLQHLIDQVAFENNVSRANFAAGLAGLETLRDAHADASSIVDLYAKFARDLHLEWTDASSLPPELAARLVATALDQPPDKRDAFLVPFDSSTVLLGLSEDEMHSVRSNVAQTLREHLRLLARAAADWQHGDVPAEFGDPFLELVSRSTIEHAEKGRIGVLTDRYSPTRFFGREDGSPAKDLAAAWRRLDSARQDTMLQSLAQSDDPVLLAELCQHLPAAAKSSIQARLRQLKPGEASTVWTYTELQHRIESLLAAGEFGLAREHFNEAAKQIERAPSQFRLPLFNLSLQLLMKEKDWAGLDAAVVPSTMDLAETRQAHEHLTFYRATSQLQRPNGDLTQARAALHGLAAHPGAASAYRENVFAIAIQQLLGPKLHPLVGTDKVAGEQLLAEINAAVSANEKLARTNLLANRALLLLALQRPDDALKSVAARRAEARSLDLDIVTVLAKTELGHRGEAMAILDAALTEFGPDDRLVALKDDLQAGVPATSVASATVVVDHISSIRVALQQLSELPPSQVGDILGPIGGGLRGYLVRQVSRAVASLQHMGAMLRDRKNPANEARLENDLNTAVREVLGASLAVAKWDVGDQSLGGATANGNPGERDAVVRASGQEICIYEALVCSGLNKSYTKQHFDKLVSYGVCETYFHVTYSYADEVQPLLDYLLHMLEKEIPASLEFIDVKPIGPPDYETSGYIATYRFGHREVTVVFLIADLHVPGRCLAAAVVPAELPSAPTAGPTC